MNYLVHPADLVFGAKAYIDGFNHVVETEDIQQKDLLDVAIHVVSEWSSDWPEDQGFGSSDRTYMIKEETLSKNLEIMEKFEDYERCQEIVNGIKFIQSKNKNGKKTKNKTGS